MSADQHGTINHAEKNIAQQSTDREKICAQRHPARTKQTKNEQRDGFRAEISKSLSGSVRRESRTLTTTNRTLSYEKYRPPAYSQKWAADYRCPTTRGSSRLPLQHESCNSLSDNRLRREKIRNFTASIPGLAACLEFPPNGEPISPVGGRANVASRQEKEPVEALTTKPDTAFPIATSLQPSTQEKQPH